MKATGIVRRIDDLGRIVIPKEIRRNNSNMCPKRSKELYPVITLVVIFLLQQTVLYPTITRDNTVYINTML